MKNWFFFTYTELKKLNSNKGLISLLSKDQINIDRTLRYLEYERNLKKLQVQLDEADKSKNNELIFWELNKFAKQRITFWKLNKLRKQGIIFLEGKLS